MQRTCAEFRSAMIGLVLHIESVAWSNTSDGDINSSVQVDIVEKCTRLIEMYSTSTLSYQCLTTIANILTFEQQSCCGSESPENSFFSY